MKSLLSFVCALSVLLMMLVPSTQTDWLMECGICKCKWNSGKKTADCKSTAITRVPTGLSIELQVLDLSNNFLPEISANEFAAANLRNLHKLFVRNATLKQINRDSLKGLEILIELDLSYNLLKSLPRSVFNNLVKLRALMLNNNRLERLDDGLFRNLKFLHKIELKENQLVRIESKAFTNLPVLTQIYLDGNQLTVLRRECFQHLEKLTGLSLKQNPWNCTCELKPFRDFAFEQNLYTPPTDCYYPEHLRGTLWSDVPMDAFACKPKILYPLGDQATVGSSHENVTISCRIQASPNTIITWTFNKHALSNYPKRMFIKNVSESSNGRDGSDVITSELTIVGVRKTDEGLYTCAAHNVGGHAEIDIQLLVGRGIDGALFLTNQMLFVLCLMAVGLLMVSTVIMIVTCCYCRKFKNLIKHDLDDHNGISGAGISLGADGTLNNGNGKKHFQAIKLNSFNNSTMIGNGSCVVGNTMVTTCATDCVDDDNGGNGSGAGIIANTNGSIKIGGGGGGAVDCEKDKFTSNEFIHATLMKSDMIVADTHTDTNNKSAAVGLTTDKKMGDAASDIRLHQIISTPNSVIVSPTRQIFGTASEHLHQMQLQHQHQYQQHHQQQRHASAETRLPPDLLPYGQHQSLALQNSLKNSSSSSTGSSTSTAILDHRNQTLNNSKNSSKNKYGFAFNDDSNIDDEDDDDVDQLFRNFVDEPDLRIYDHDVSITTSGGNFLTTTTKPFGLLSSTLTTTTTTAIASGKITSILPSNRTNKYELSSPSSRFNTNYSSKSHNKTNPNLYGTNNSIATTTAAVTTHHNNAQIPHYQPHTQYLLNATNKAIIDNNGSSGGSGGGGGAGVNCKPRQSIVRTSPSFSFLSTGYNQQHDNFL